MIGRLAAGVSVNSAATLIVSAMLIVPRLVGVRIQNASPTRHAANQSAMLSSGSVGDPLETMIARDAAAFSPTKPAIAYFEVGFISPAPLVGGLVQCGLFPPAVPAMTSFQQCFLEGAIHR